MSGFLLSSGDSSFVVYSDFVLYILFCYMSIISVLSIRPSRLGFVYNGPLSKFFIQGLFLNY